MLSFNCTSCQKNLSIKEEHAGRKIKCPACGQVTLSPASAPTVATPPRQPTQAYAATAPTIPKADVSDHALMLASLLAPAQAPDELGRLGKYRVLTILGQGGMGIVFKAEDSVLKRMVAVKALLPSLGADDHARQRFLREAKAMAALHSDHVVRLYEVNEDRGIPYIAMEFLIGEPLDRRLANDRLLPLPEALRIGREITEGLAAAHERGLIHRDIKPANLWLEAPQGRVKILDFGLARDDSDENRLTLDGTIIGTPSHMAPEQARGEEVDARCDLFSLGVVLYRLTTGREPFVGADSVSTLTAVNNETPPSPQMVNFEVPADLSDLIMLLLEKDPAKRGGPARAVVEALARIERGEPAPLPGSQPTPAADDPNQGRENTQGQPKAKPPAGKFPWLIVLGVIAALVVCVAVPLVGAALFLLR